MNKIGMISLGCPKNQVDAEMMLSSLCEAGFEIQTCSGEVAIICDMWKEWTEKTDFIGRRKSYRR